MLRDRSPRKRMRRCVLRSSHRLVPALPERGVRSDGVPVATRTTTPQDDTMHARRYLLSALVLPVFSLCAREPGAAPRGEKIADASLRATSSISELSSMMARLAARKLPISHTLTLQSTRGFSA